MSLPAPHPIRTLEQIRRVLWQGDYVTLPCYEIVVDGKSIRYVETDRLVHDRVATIFAKEPTTIPWLEAIGAGETLVDIGANIGLYSVYAAVMTGCRVFAFEPEALNYAELNKNIHVNGLSGQMAAFCLAMSDEQKVDYLQLGAFGVGYSHHDFGENTWTGDKDFGVATTRKDERLQQGAVSTTLDALVAAGAVPVPDHVKIDVDGLEHRVVAGARETLADPRVKSVLLEVDHSIEVCHALIEQMTALGWRHSLAQLCTNRKRVLPEREIDRLQQQRRGGLNYVFFRDAAYGELFERFLASYEPPLDEAGRLRHPPRVVAQPPPKGTARHPEPPWVPPTLGRALKDIGRALWWTGRRLRKRGPRAG